jgi:hypothetical protein
VARAAAGDEVVIGTAGHPLAASCRFDAVREERRPGRLSGKLWVAEDFADTPPEVLRAFEDG